MRISAKTFLSPLVIFDENERTFGPVWLDSCLTGISKRAPRGPIRFRISLEKPNLQSSRLLPLMPSEHQKPSAAVFSFHRMGWWQQTNTVINKNHVTGAVTANAPGYLTPTSANRFA